MICGDCGVEEGEIHQFGCDTERCPICKDQLLGCGHTPPDEVREPFFGIRGFSCERCNKYMPSMHMIPLEDWKKICGVTYPLDCVLCLSCMKFIANKRGFELEGIKPISFEIIDGVRE